MSAILAVVLLVVPLYSVLVARGWATAAADAAALAAADVAVGIAPGVPCSTAASVAKINRAVVTECQADGVMVTVRVSIPVLGFPVSATATAGPPAMAP
ncbi:Rv3654c family TadE-like protein [Leifsonella bigeumensis]|uniref:Rv3654c family TadE-like protein n=1 Tax=Leifsonella bigeumensis TaxID=433643 RepID=UPI0031E47858